MLYADVAKQVDALDLGSSAARRGGSNPSIRTQFVGRSLRNEAGPLPKRAKSLRCSRALPIVIYFAHNIQTSHNPNIRM